MIEDSLFGFELLSPRHVFRSKWQLAEAHNVNIFFGEAVDGTRRYSADASQERKRN